MTLVRCQEKEYIAQRLMCFSSLALQGFVLPSLMRLKVAVEPGSVEECLGPRFLCLEAPGVTDTPHGLGVSPWGTSRGKTLSLPDSFSDLSLKRDRNIADEKDKGVTSKELF